MERLECDCRTAWWRLLRKPRGPGGSSLAAARSCGLHSTNRVTSALAAVLFLKSHSPRTHHETAVGFSRDCDSQEITVRKDCLLKTGPLAVPGKQSVVSRLMRERAIDVRFLWFATRKLKVRAPRSSLVAADIHAGGPCSGKAACADSAASASSPRLSALDACSPPAAFNTSTAHATRLPTEA